MSAWLTWAILGLALIGFEMVTPSFFIIWFGIGALAAALVAGLGLSLTWQLVVFLLCTSALLAYSRKFAAKVRGGSDTKTGYAALIGKQAIVTKRISAHTGTGQVKVLGEEWSALAETERNIGPGEKVEVVAVSGVRLIVRPLKENQENKEE